MAILPALKLPAQYSGSKADGYFVDAYEEAFFPYASFRLSLPAEEMGVYQLAYCRVCKTATRMLFLYECNYYI